MPPTNREQFKDYVLRRLGWPVIEINVDEDQMEDRIDDAVQYFRDYHFDGVEKLFMPHQLTAADIANKWIPIPDPVISIVNVVPVQETHQAMNMFDLRYQMRLFDLFTFTSTSIIHYDLLQKHLALLNFEFNADPRIQFNRHQGRLHVNWNWDQDVREGDFIIVECFRVLDPNDWPKVWNDRWLKEYATALIKRQWGMNLMKYQGVALPGNVTLNGEAIYTQANDEIQRIEQEVSLKYELPVDFFMG